MINILLLTNKDSDNIGDQVIEACDISLINLVMNNLGFTEEQYIINSKPAGIVPRKYMATYDSSYLINVRNAINDNDIVVFGGAPLFNYAYQMFYERTAVTIEIAQEFGKPVIFSAIGIEGYDEENDKCQRLKKTLNYDCVKMITTRDDFDSLMKYKENEDLVINKVSDPAVFSDLVFAPFIEKSNRESERKKVGIFVIRANAFVDNGIQYPWPEAAEFWKDFTNLLDQKDYDYEIVTSGHFGDEAFLDQLIKSGYLDNNKSSFNMNCPEDLFKKLSSFDAVVSCRLHPSIISYSLDIPSISLVWNSKVKGFYDSIGYPDRIVDPRDADLAGTVFDKLRNAIDDGIKKDQDYLMSVYNNLFYGIKTSLSEKYDVKDVAVYDYEAIKEKIKAYPGTSEKEKDEKLQRKFRRAYGKYNDNKEDKAQLKKEVKELKQKVIKHKTTKQAFKNIIKNIFPFIHKFYSKIKYTG